jgi:hypothetical protein
MRRPALLLSLLLSACSTYTADYQARLVESMPDKNRVTFDRMETFRGRVLCGEYTAYRRDGYGQKTSAFVVTPELTLTDPGDDKRAVFCSDDPEASLFSTFGISAAEADRPALGKISGDMALIETAVLAFYNDRGYAPQTLEQLLEGDFGATDADLEDPWGRPYRFSAGLAGRSLPRFTLSTLGRDGARGGTGPDADIDNHMIDVVRHVLAISEP